MMSASETIKNIRIHLLLSQTDFAEKLGVSRQIINNYEHRQRKPSLKFIKKLKEVAEQNNIPFNINDLIEDE